MLFLHLWFKCPILSSKWNIAYISGGSLANMYGMVLARFDKFPEVKTKGMANIGELVAFTSQEVSLSISY